jgi:hypothetical protein
VMWTLEPDAFGRSAEENASEMKTRIEALNGRIPGLMHIEVGIDTSDSDESADVALYSEFTDRAALDTYQAHPEHAAVAEFIGRVCKSRTVVDYQTQ